MIYLRPHEFEVHQHNGIYVIRGTHQLTCPHCGGTLQVHGTCLRKLRTIYCTRTYRLRVMKCRGCGKTHRELPAFFVPYKRYGLNSICEILCSEKGLHTCDTSTRCRFLAHCWFHILENGLQRVLPFGKQSEQHCPILCDYGGYCSN